MAFGSLVRGAENDATCPQDTTGAPGRIQDVTLAYDSGEQLNNRPASSIAGVQRGLSSDGACVGADSNTATITGSVLKAAETPTPPPVMRQPAFHVQVGHLARRIDDEERSAQEMIKKRLSWHPVWVVVYLEGQGLYKDNKFRAFSVLGVAEEQLFNYYVATLRDVFEFMIEYRGMGAAATHVLRTVVGRELLGLDQTLHQANKWRCIDDVREQEGLFLELCRRSSRRRSQTTPRLSLLHGQSRWRCLAVRAAQQARLKAWRDKCEQERAKRTAARCKAWRDKCDQARAKRKAQAATLRAAQQARRDSRSPKQEFEISVESMRKIVRCLAPGSNNGRIVDDISIWAFVNSELAIPHVPGLCPLTAVECAGLCVDHPLEQCTTLTRLVRAASPALARLVADGSLVAVGPYRWRVAAMPPPANSH